MCTRSVCVYVLDRSNGGAVGKRKGGGVKGEGEKGREVRGLGGGGGRWRGQPEGW